MFRNFGSVEEIAKAEFKRKKDGRRKMINREKAIQMYMKEEGMTRKQAEEYVDIMEGALEGWENPWTDDSEERWSATCPWKAPGMRISDFL